jgi:membrane-bound lytic murein transglycosylase B
MLVGAVPVLAADVDAPPSPQLLARQLRSASQDMTEASVESGWLQNRPAQADPLAQVRQDLKVARADYRFRVAVRAEQAVLYRLAADPALAAATIRLVPAGQAPALGHAVDALRALWAHAGIPEGTPVRVRYEHRPAAPTGIPELSTYYRQAAARYGIDWTYLAAINYIESHFGRVNGPSSAGAMGPMQFLPSTWRQYGEGDIMDARDSIAAAAKYLARNGAPGNMPRAIFRYNNDLDYVDAVEAFAAAIRADPLWLNRLFYWSTQG